jgi:hypothetical protein
MHERVMKSHVLAHTLDLVFQKNISFFQQEKWKKQQENLHRHGQRSRGAPKR